MNRKLPNWKPHLQSLVRYLMYHRRTQSKLVKRLIATSVPFLNGKQKRVPRPPTVVGLPVDEFIRRNADPIWLHQNEQWDQMPDPY